MKIFLKFMSLILVCLFALSSCISFCEDLYNALDTNSQYYLGAGWNVDDETFASEYYDLYLNKIQSLKEKYELDCLIHIERSSLNEEGNDKNKLVVFLYCEKYTILFEFTNCHDLGYYDAELYYYGDTQPSEDYSDFSPLVEFINDITNYAAYDAKTESNRFEELYYEAVVDDDNNCAMDEYHHDSIIGGVYYLVNLNYIDEYYYMLQHDSSFAKKAYDFRFNGILKPLK